MRFFCLLCALALVGCAGRITPEKIALVKPGMTEAQAEAILGPPARIEEAETTGIRGKVYHYPAGQEEAQVVFLNDQVYRAALVPVPKSP